MADNSLLGRVELPQRFLQDTVKEEDIAGFFPPTTSNL